MVRGRLKLCVMLARTGQGNTPFTHVHSECKWGHILYVKQQDCFITAMLFYSKHAGISGNSCVYFCDSDCEVLIMHIFIPFIPN